MKIGIVYCLSLFFGIASIALIACDTVDSLKGEADSGTPEGQDTNDPPVPEVGEERSPSVGISNLIAYQGVDGTVSLQAEASHASGIAQVSLFVDGETIATLSVAPYVFEWDTTAHDDGIAAITAQATSLDGSTGQTDDDIRVAIVNHGAVMELFEGPTGTLSVPEDFDGTQEVHQKRHWTSENDYDRVIAVYRWKDEADQEPWSISLEMGVGTCPHSGQSFGDIKTGRGGVVEFDLVPDGGLPAGQTYFLHAGAEIPEDCMGRSHAYTMHVFAFNTPTEEAPNTKSDDLSPCPPDFECVADAEGGVCLR